VIIMAGILAVWINPVTDRFSPAGPSASHHSLHPGRGLSLEGFEDFPVEIRSSGKSKHVERSRPSISGTVLKNPAVGPGWIKQYRHGMGDWNLKSGGVAQIRPCWLTVQDRIVP
jgi:hypothetical protein